MKKIIAILCVAMLLIGTAVPALADQGKGPGGQSAGTSSERGGDRNGPGGSGDRTAPGKPSGDNSSSAPGKGGKPDDAPMNKPGSTDSTQSATAPADKPEGGPSSGNGNKPDERKNSLQKLLDDGKLSQTTYDAIQSYMKANASAASGDAQTPPEKPEGEPSSSASGDAQTPPEKPEGEPASDASGKNPPEKPEGSPNGDPSLPGKETLDAMLSEGLITEDEYNLLLEAIEKPAASSDSDSESTESASSDETTTTDETAV